MTVILNLLFFRYWPNLFYIVDVWLRATPAMDLIRPPLPRDDPIDTITNCCYWTWRIQRDSLPYCAYTCVGLDHACVGNPSSLLQTTLLFMPDRFWTTIVLTIPTRFLNGRPNFAPWRIIWNIDWYWRTQYYLTPIIWLIDVLFALIVILNYLLVIFFSSCVVMEELPDQLVVLVNYSQMDEPHDGQAILIPIIADGISIIVLVVWRWHLLRLLSDNSLIGVLLKPDLIYQTEWPDLFPFITPLTIVVGLLMLFPMTFWTT